MKRLAFCAFWLFIFCSPSIGQVNTGPKVITRNLRQDKKGNIWIAAYDGVFRYDGKSFTNLTSKLSPARYFSLLEDQKGNFWFSTVGSGIYYYDGNAFTNFTTTDGLVHNTVTEIYQDRAGNTWFSTLRGLSRYDGKSFKNYLPDEAHPEGDNNDINYILEDKTGKFWIATRGNAYTFDGSTFTILSNKGTTFTNTRSIIEDKQGNVLLDGSTGLWRYDGKTFTHLTQDFVGYILEDKKGNIWTSSQSRTADRRWMLSRYDENSISGNKPRVTEIKSEHADNRGMIFGILEASDGTIWFGALDGVHRYNLTTNTASRLD